MICELCGSKEAILLVDVEGAKLRLCDGCAKFGSTVSRLKSADALKAAEKPRKLKSPEREILQIVVQDYATLMRKKRESLGLKQEEFAKLVAEKESTIHKIETNQYEPGLDLARKLERILKIKLIEQHEEILKREVAPANSNLTIGDFVKVKKARQE